MMKVVNTKKLIVALNVINLLIIGVSLIVCQSNALGIIDTIMVVAIVINAIIISGTITRKLLITIAVAAVVQFLYCITAIDENTEADADYHRWRMGYFIPGLSTPSDNAIYFFNNYFGYYLLLILLIQLVVFCWALYTLWLKRIS